MALRAQPLYRTSTSALFLYFYVVYRERRDVKKKWTKKLNKKHSGKYILTLYATDNKYL